MSYVLVDQPREGVTQISLHRPERTNAMVFVPGRPGRPGLDIFDGLTAGELGLSYLLPRAHWQLSRL